MSQNNRELTSVFRIDVAQNSASQPVPSPFADDQETKNLLRQLVQSQNRSNELLANLAEQMSAGQRQRTAELGQWKDANPVLARRCRAAAEAISKVQTEFLGMMTQEIGESYESMMDGEFVLNEFIDRFGPRLAHLNGVLQLLSQLSSVPTATPQD